jgi:hypothetical protein
MALFKRKMNNPGEINSPSHAKTVEVSDYSIWQLISEIRNLATSINYVYAEYDLMAEDTIIGAALNLYADNAIQQDNSSDSIIEITSDNPALSSDLRAVLSRLDIESRLWNVAYNTAKYGNKYWKVILNHSGNDIAGLEEIDDPSCVLDLYLTGEPKWFAFTESDLQIQKTQDYELYDREAFIHFYIQSGKLNDTIDLIDNQQTDENGDPLTLKYQIKRGESMIEGVRLIYRVLKALEDSLLAARIAKSEYTKIYNVEVGDSNEIDAKKMVDKVKRLFDSRMAMNTKEGQQSAKSYNQPRPFMDPVFNSVNNGKGAISIETSGGEFEVSNIADIDYFNKLKFSGLHITPSMLAFEENIPGGLSGEGSTMIQQDIRFAMYVKKLIVAILDGITDLLNLWLHLKGRDSEIGKFRLKMAVPSIAEDLASLQELISRLESIDQMTDIIAKNSPGVNTAKLTKILLNEYIPNKVLLSKINDLIDESAEIADKESQIAMEEANTTLRQLKDDEVPADDIIKSMEDDRDRSTERGYDVNYTSPSDVVKMMTGD